jgi:large subunit ribosomal protein L14e
MVGRLPALPALTELGTGTMGFTRFVEIGRVCLVTYGPDRGKLCTILDVADNNKALVDGPEPVTGVKRQLIPFKRLELTDFTVEILRNAREKTLTKALKDADVIAKWEASAWSKKLESKRKRASTNDFDRFKVMVAKKQRSAIIAKEVQKLSS